MVIHLTSKNFCIWLFGVCALLLAAISIIVPSSQWGLSPLKWIIFALVIVAAIAVTVQLLMQSREDHKRDEKEAKRDEIQQSMAAQLAQLSPRDTDTSLSLRVANNGATQPLTPPVNFDAASYFRVSYHSQLTEDIEKRIRIAAEQNKSYCSPEDFYAKFIGVGLVSYFHDITWAYIFKSQILMLTEMNRRGGVLPVTEARKFYDNAACGSQSFYANYSLDQWIEFMTAHALLIRHPSEMLEITVRGRDFLSYSAHYSRNPDERNG